MSTRDLLRQHAELIERSAIAPDVARERGYYSETVKARLGELGFGASQQRVPALVLPIHGVTGGVVGYQIRPDDPRSKRGKPLKYETPFKWRMRADMHPHARKNAGNPKVPLIGTEGIRKGDAAVSAGLCAFALLGVWNWRGTNANGGKVALPDFEHIALNDGRPVLLVPDSDAAENPNVFDAFARLAELLRLRGADVRHVGLPRLDGGAKCGLDDFFAAGHSVDELFALSTETPRRPEPKSAAPKFTGQLPTTAELLNLVRGFVLDYVVMGEHEADAVALWILHTHAFAAAGSTPYLAINSAEPESGKTLLLEVLAELVARPWLTGRASAAALVRKVDGDRPTLLLDESDASFNGVPEYAETLRGILNTGYRASGKASVCVGQGADITVRDFVTFCPKAIAGLGKLPDTVRSRSIPVRLKRRRRDEVVAEWLSSDPPPEAEDLRVRLEAWATKHADALRRKRPARPHGIGDRSYDVWRPLLAIADLAGEPWAERARVAAVALNGKADATRPDSHGVALLAKLRALFEDADPITSADAVAAINADEELPFGGWNDDDGMTARELARRLKSYGIRPKVIRMGENTPRGYRAAQFTDAFARYAPPISGDSSATSATSTAQSQKSAEIHPTQDTRVSDDRDAANPHGTRDVSDVADNGAGDGGESADALFPRLPAGPYDDPAEGWKR